MDQEQAVQIDRLVMPFIIMKHFKSKQATTSKASTKSRKPAQKRFSPESSATLTAEDITSQIPLNRRKIIQKHTQSSPASRLRKETLETAEHVFEDGKNNQATLNNTMSLEANEDTLLQKENRFLLPTLFETFAGDLDINWHRDPPVPETFIQPPEQTRYSNEVLTPQPPNQFATPFNDDFIDQYLS